MPLSVDVQGLVWDEENESHVERRIHTWEIDEFIEGGDFYAFPNKENHPPHYLKFIGRTPSGWFVTAIIQRPQDGDARHWRPVTGWPSTATERGMYSQEKRRLQRKQGKKHG